MVRLCHHGLGVKNAQIERTNMTTRTKAQVEVDSPITESFAGWAKLNATKISEEDQKVVMHEVEAVFEARKNEARSKEAIGQHLRKLKEILEPKRIFVSSIKYFFKMSRATAYRYMEMAEVAETILPGPVFEAAIERGTPIRKETIQQMPPPNTTDVAEISAYLSKLEELPQRRPQAALETDEEVLAKEIVNFAGTRIDRLKASNKDVDVESFTKRVVALILTKAGIKTQQKVVPLDIPESYIVHRGAPRKEQPDKKAA